MYTKDSDYEKHMAEQLTWRCEGCGELLYRREPLPGSVVGHFARGGHTGAHGHRFCSMACADAWENDPANAAAVAQSAARANCSAYVECACSAMMLDLRPSTPRFASCDAQCPLRAAIDRAAARAPGGGSQ